MYLPGGDLPGGDLPGGIYQEEISWYLPRYCELLCPHPYLHSPWPPQLCDFITEVVGSPAFIVCNSVGGLAGLEAAVAQPALVRGVQLIDISLRGLHVKRTSPLARPFVAALQRVLRETQLGQAFFGSIAKPQTVRNILREAYGRKEAVTDELVDKILSPGLLPGAVDVFLDFICYSGGPLPEELLEKTTVPVSMLWGEKVCAYAGSVKCSFPGHEAQLTTGSFIFLSQDPWENAQAGKALFSGYPCVYEFITLPGEPQQLFSCKHAALPGSTAVSECPEHSTYSFFLSEQALGIAPRMRPRRWSTRSFKSL